MLLTVTRFRIWLTNSQAKLNSPLAIKSYCWPLYDDISLTNLKEITTNIPDGTVKFRTTITGDITQENFYCFVGTIYASEIVTNNELFVIAWDGSSIPDVSKIPAGVTVKYNNINYTGTLSVSDARPGAFYFVGERQENDDFGRFDEYVIVNDGSNIYWERIGDSNSNLSKYYIKPAGGIPYEDLSEGVKASLDKADLAQITSSGSIFPSNPKEGDIFTMLAHDDVPATNYEYVNGVWVKRGTVEIIYATTEEILALFVPIYTENTIEGHIIILGSGNSVVDDIIVFGDSTTINNNTINLY